MSLNSPFDCDTELASLDANPSKLIRRSDAELPFDVGMVDGSKSLIFDTNVYIHALKGRLPADVVDLIARVAILHASPAIAELTVALSRIDAGHPNARKDRAVIRQTLGDMDRSRIRVPTSDAWQRAALKAGHAAKVLKIQKPFMPKILSDALIFEIARETEATLLTSNIIDFDGLLQLDANASVLFYRSL